MNSLGTHCSLVRRVPRVRGGLGMQIPVRRQAGVMYPSPWHSGLFLF